MPLGPKVTVAAPPAELELELGEAAAGKSSALLVSRRWHFH